MKLVIEEITDAPPFVYDGESPYDLAATERARRVYDLLPEARHELRTGIRNPRKGFLMNKARQYARQEAETEARVKAKRDAQAQEAAE
jgi:hypothetical protein